MIRTGDTRDSYTGKAGQMALLAELLARRCNVAVPEVDEGEDVLVFVTGEPSVARLQVKTANAERLKELGRYAAKVSVPLGQLNAISRTELFYVFAIRLEDKYIDFLHIRRSELNRLSMRGVGYRNEGAGELQLYLSFGPDTIVCSGQNWQRFRNAWASLPVTARLGQD